MIHVKNLTKKYGRHLAVDNASFKVDRKEVLGFLGPNGAGKSTTMNMLTGYLSASAGEILIDGKSILEEPETVKRKIGYLPENPPLYDDMTVREYLYFACRIKKIPKSETGQRIDRELNRVGISDVFTRRIGNLSKGYRQRVGLAQALVGNPEILILDEPTAGLDPKQIIDIRDLIRELGSSYTVILSSHILPEISEICKRVLVINNGRIVADGNPAILGRDLFDTSQIVVTTLAGRETAHAIIAGIPGVRSIQELSATEENTTEILVLTDKDKDLRSDVFEAFSAAAVPLIGLRVKNATLEEIFLELTNGSAEVPT